MSSLIPLINSKERLVRIAKNLFEQGDRLGGISILRSVLNNAPMDFEANLTLAEFYCSTYNMNQSQRYALRAYASIYDEEGEMAVFALLDANGYLERKVEALSKYAVANVFFKEEMESIKGMVRSETILSDGNNSGFTVVYDSTRNANIEYYKKGRSAFCNGNLEDAVTLLKGVSKDSKYYLRAQEMVALSWLVLGEYETAAKVAEEIDEIQPDNFTAWVVACACYVALGLREDYDDVFSKLKYFDVSAELYCDVITIALSKEDYEGVLFASDRYLKERELDSYALYVRAVARYNVGDVDGCKEDLKKSLNVFEDEVVRCAYEEVCYNKQPKTFKVNTCISRKVVERELSAFFNRLDEQGEGYVVDESEFMRVCGYVVRSNAPELFVPLIRLGNKHFPKKMEEYVSAVMMDLYVSDDVKMYVISDMIFSEGVYKFKCINRGIVKSIDLRPMKIEGYAAELFKEVYKHVAFNVLVFDSDALPLLRKALRRMQRNYKENNGNEYANFAPIAAAVAFSLNVNGLSNEEIVCGLFNVTKEEFYNAALLLLKKEKEE